MNCRVCSIPLSPWGETAGVPLLKCPDCGAIHADCLKPSGDMYADLYRTEERVPAVVAASLDAVVRSMTTYRTSGKWLDVGFGQGALLDAAVRGGWLAHGTEVSEVALEKGRARGFETARGTEAFGANTFDVVSLVELVEHVESPEEFFREARRVLRPGGCLYLTTPNARSLNRWFLGSKWTVFAPPDHITIFTPRSLRQLLVRTGFGHVSLRTEGLNPFEILGALRGARGSARDRRECSTGLCERLSSSPGRRRMKTLANAVLRASGVGDSLKARAR